MADAWSATGRVVAGLSRWPLHLLGGALLWLCLMLPGAGHAESDTSLPTLVQSLDKRLAALAAQLDKDDRAQKSAQDWTQNAAQDGQVDRLRAEIGLPVLPHEGAPATVDPVDPDLPVATATRADMRLALVALSQAYDTDDNDAVFAAQPNGRMDAVWFRGGRVTLVDLLKETQRLMPGAGAEDTLAAPVVLWDDTVLILSPGEVLSLSRAEGAFLLSFGRVHITGSTVRGAGAPNPRSPQFAPFIAVAGGGALTLSGAHVQNLGFGYSGKYSGIALLGSMLRRPLASSWIAGTRFDTLQGVTIAGRADVRVRGNSFADMGDTGLRVESADRARIESNLFYGRTATISVHITQGSQDSMTRGNIILGGDRAGIVADKDSNRPWIQDNIIWHRSGSGIKLDSLSCGTVYRNILLENRQKGVEIRRSEASLVSRNLIAANRNAGLWVSDQRAGAEIRAEANVLHGNRSGLYMASGGAVILSGNNLSHQMPRVFGGDIARHTVAILDDLRGSQPRRIDSAAISKVTAPSGPACAPKEGA